MPVKRDYSMKGSIMLTSCPCKPDTQVGSYGCEQCEYFIGRHWRDEKEDRTYVLCDCETDLENKISKATKPKIKFASKPKFKGFIGQEGFEYIPVFLEDTAECIMRVNDLYKGKVGVDYGRKSPVFKFYTDSNVEYKKDGSTVSRKCGYITGKLGDYCIFAEDGSWVYIVADLFKDGKYGLVE